MAAEPQPAPKIPELSQDSQLTDLLPVVAHYWRTYVTVLVSTVVVGVGLAFFMSPVYRAEVLLAPQRSAEAPRGLESILGPFSGLASLAGIGGISDDDKKEALATLSSRGFTDRFITDQQLLPVLFEKKWDNAKHQWNVDEDEIPTMADAYRLFDEKIRSVYDDQDTGLVTLAIEWTDPDQAAEWANLLVRRLNTEKRDEAIRTAQAHISYLNAELEKTPVIELREAIYRLLQVEINKIMLAKGEDDFAFHVVDPAVVPDADKFVRPMRALMVVAGVLLGGILGVVAVVARNLMDKS